MLNLGYVNRFGSGVNTVSTLLEENKSNPAEFLLGDYTTFKVVVKNADVIESSTNVIEKTPHVIVNVIETPTDVIENGTNAIEKTRGEKILEILRIDKRISVKQLAAKLSVTSRTIFREIDELKASGKLKRVGSDRSGTWEVIE